MTAVMRESTGSESSDADDTSGLRHIILRLQDVSVTFGHLEALKHVSLGLRNNEILAVVGDNGAGKSTLLKVLCGLYTPDPGGSIFFHNEQISLSSIRDAKRHGIVSVFQNQEFCPNLDVTQNLYLGRELTSGWGLLENKKMERSARKVLLDLAAPLGLHKRISTLTRGQAQMLAISKTLLDDPEVLLLDEPTASLSVLQTAQVLRYIRHLRDEGKTILFICNSLPDVFAIADRVAVLRQGRIAAIQDIADTSYEQIISLIAGVDADSVEAQRLGDAYEQLDSHSPLRLDRNDDSLTTLGKEEETEDTEDKDNAW